MDSLHRAFGGGAHTVSHESLKAFEEKYHPILLLAQQQGLRIQSLSVQGERLVLVATAPSSAARRHILQEIALLDPNREEVDAKITVAQGDD